MVATTEHVADFRQTVVGQLLGQGHGYLTRARDRTRTTLGQQIGDLDLVVLSDSTLNVIHTDQFVLQRQQILERFTNQLDGDVTAHEMRVSDNPLQCTFQLTDVGSNALSDEKGCVMRELDFGLVGLLHQDCYAGLQLWRLDSHRQAPTKARLQTLFQAFDFLGIAVRGKDYLLATLKQGVEGVEKLFLRALFASEELDIVDQQRVHRAVEALEFVDGVELQRFDHVRDETLRMQVHHLGVRILLQQMVTHSMHKVGFTQTHTAIKEQWVVAMLRVVRNLPGSRAGELVRLTFDESVKGKGPVQVTGVLERTFNLHGALFSPATTGRRSSRLGHGIKAVTRRRLDQYRLGCSHGNGFNRCCRGCLVCLSLRQRSRNGSAHRRVRRSPWGRAATATY